MNQTTLTTRDRGWAEVREALSIIARIERQWTRQLGKRRMEQLRELLTELNAGPGHRD